LIGPLKLEVKAMLGRGRREAVSSRSAGPARPHRGSMTKACSPSKMPGSSTRPSQRSSRSGSAIRTVGRKVIGLRLIGWAVTSSLLSTFASPMMRMKGFHSG
jgi:hypothetical protein